jgi:hypothetical protein
VTYEEFLHVWVSTLRGSGLQIFGAHDGTETLDPRSMARSYEGFVEPLGGQETEPFFVTAGFSWRWDALLTARTHFREEDVLTELLGRARGSKASTERPAVRLDVSLRASLPYGKPVPMPSAEAWAKWAREVHTRLEKIEPLMPKRTTRGTAKRPEVLAWLTDPVAKVTCDPDGFLELERVEVAAGQIIDIPRNWDDTSRKPDKHPAEQLDAMFKRVRASLHAWMQALDHLLPKKGSKR